jgi:hypothetical protein
MRSRLVFVVIPLLFMPCQVRSMQGLDRKKSSRTESQGLYSGQLFGRHTGSWGERVNELEHLPGHIICAAEL